MTYLDASHTILKAEGQPLRYEEITERCSGQATHFAPASDARTEDGVADTY